MASAVLHKKKSSDQATSTEVLSAWVRDARARALQLVADLDDDQLIGPKLPIVNPLLWEMGHAAWFQEYRVLQQGAGHKPVHPGDEMLFDSIGIEHDVRWDLPLPSRPQTIRYLEQVRDAVLELLDQGDLSDELIYLIKLSVFHEDMHTESFTWTRQTLAYPAPNFEVLEQQSWPGSHSGDLAGDIQLSGGPFLLGAHPNASFVFDNEKWAHPVQVEPFAIARVAVTRQQFAEFVNDRGYNRRELWCESGWQWREQTGAAHPVYWKRDGDGWLCRQFDQWQPLEPDLPMVHLNWFEADAWCRWAGRRLPTEAEWEYASAASDQRASETAAGKRHYPWGQVPPGPRYANMDWQAMGTVPVQAHGAGDTPAGCRQLMGNVWEWTASTFEPYPGFSPDVYEEYSQPVFGQWQVLRGGCWATRSRMMRNTLRNFFGPERQDVFAGFRTCAM